MTERFDPYHQWLGIAPKDQPPHHYRLLGIDAFEESADVIEHAADRQMAHVRSLQAGKHGEDAQRLLNEIAAAKVTLLDADKKASYDEALRRRTKKKRQELPVAAPLPIEQPAATPAIEPAAPAKSSAGPSGVLIAAIAGGVLALLAVVAVGVGVAWSFMSPASRQVAVENNNAVVESTPAVTPTANEQNDVTTEDAATPPVIPPPPVVGTNDEEQAPPAEDVEPPAIAEKQPETNDPPQSNDDNKDEQLALADIGEPVGQADTAKRSPVPDKGQREAKRQEILAIFRPAEAKTIDEKQAVVDRLLETAGQTKSDPPGRFALLNLAREVASSAGDIERSFAAVDALDESFEIDSGAVKVASIEQAARETLPTKSKEQLVAAGMGLVDELMVDDQYEKAAALITTLQLSARQLRDRDTIEALAERRKRGAELFQHYQRASAALETLKTKPDDAQANATAGAYVALVKGDWAGGLPMLAKGDDEGLRRIAEMEMAKPPAAGDQAKLADAWWDAAADRPELIQQQMQAHALEWYQQAAPSLTGLDAARVKARIAAAAEAGIGQVASAGGPSSTGEEGGDDPQEDPQGIQWAPVPEDGKLSRAISLGPFPHDADDRLIVTFLAKAKMEDDLGGRKLVRQLAEKDGKFRGSLVQKTEKFYVFRIHSEKEQAALLVAETFTSWGHSTVDVMVNYRPAPRNGQVPLVKGDNIIIAKHNHNKSDRDDRSWIKISLAGEGLQQGY